MAITKQPFLAVLKELMTQEHIDEVQRICAREYIDVSRENIEDVYRFLKKNVNDIIRDGMRQQQSFDFDQRLPYKIFRPRNHTGLPVSIEIVYNLDDTFPGVYIKSKDSSRGSFKKYRKAINLGLCDKDNMVAGIKRALLVVGTKDKNVGKRYRSKVNDLIRESEISEDLAKISKKYFDQQRYVTAYFYEKPVTKKSSHPEFKEGSTMATLICRPALCSLEDVFDNNKDAVPNEFYSFYINQKQEYFKQGRVAPLSIHLARSLLYATQLMHKHGYIHRDLKPANILLCKDRQYFLRITDFGHTKAASESGRKTATRPWSSPQVFDYIANRDGRGRSRAARFNEMRDDTYAGQVLDKEFTIKNPIDEATIKDDMWSIGVILFELYTGIYPRVDEYTHSVLKVNPLLKGLLEPDEDSRIDTAKALDIVDICDKAIVPNDSTMSHN